MKQDEKLAPNIGIFFSLIGMTLCNKKRQTYSNDTDNILVSTACATKSAYYKAGE